MQERQRMSISRTVTAVQRADRRQGAGHRRAGAHENILHLQRAAGNAAVTDALAGRGGAVVVQRYKSLGAGVATLPSAEKQRRRRMFAAHEADPVVDDVAEGLDWGHQFGITDPSLLTSDDQTIVIQDTTKEPQEFYATSSVRKQAVRVLKEHDSLIDLEVSNSATLTLGDNKLKRVTARSLLVPFVARAEGEIESILDHICINFANVVLGLQQQQRFHEAILQTGTDSKHAKRVPVTSDMLSSDQIERLAQQVGETGETLHKKPARTAMGHGGAAAETTGEVYGRQLGKGELDDSAKRLGINQYAAPEVGEAYGTYTIKTDSSAEKRDYSELVADQPTLRKFAWGYHYAGVVAESADGKDKVTLENYNRTGDIYQAFGKRLIADYGQGIKERVKAAARARDRTELSQLYAELAGGDEDQKAAGAKQFTDAISDGFTEALRTWFFRLYGTRAGSGQTFHEQSAASGFFANPLTVRVGAADDTKYNQATTRRFGKLAEVAHRAPGDYEQDKGLVRPRSPVYAARNKVADLITGAADEATARDRLRTGLLEMQVDQQRLHYTFVLLRARQAGVEQDDLPGGIPTDLDGFDNGFDLIRQACENKRNRLYRGKKERRAALDEVAGLAVEVKQAVQGQATYYDQYTA